MEESNVAIRDAIEELLHERRDDGRWNPADVSINDVAEKLFGGTALGRSRKRTRKSNRHLNLFRRDVQDNWLYILGFMRREEKILLYPLSEEAFAAEKPQTIEDAGRQVAIKGRRAVGVALASRDDLRFQAYEEFNLYRTSRGAVVKIEETGAGHTRGKLSTEQTEQVLLGDGNDSIGEIGPSVHEAVRGDRQLTLAVRKALMPPR